MNKTQPVLAFIRGNPKATGNQVVAALADQGIVISLGYVAVIKCKHRDKKVPEPVFSADTISLAVELLRLAGTQRRAVALCWALHRQPERERAEKMGQYGLDAVHLASKLGKIVPDEDAVFDLLLSLGDGTLETILP